MFHISDIQAQQLFAHTYNPGYEIESKKINCLCEDERGFVFIGTNGAVFLFDGTDYEALPFPDSLTSVGISKLLAVENSLYAGLENGMLLYWSNLRLMNSPVLLFKAMAGITDIEIQEHKIWVASYGSGIFLGSETEAFVAINGMPDQYIYDLQADQSNNMWCGTDAGLLKISSQENGNQGLNIRLIDGLPDLIVTSIFADEAKTLWLGFHDAGFCSYDLTAETIRNYVATTNWKAGKVKALHRKDQYLWISSESSELLAFDVEKQQLVTWQAENNSNIPQRISGFSASKLRGFWLIGNEQFAWLAGRQIELIHHLDGFDCSNTSAILADRHNRLWWSNEQGLFVCDIESGTYRNVREVRNVRLQNIGMASCLFEDHRGNIWMGTLANGVFRIDPDKLSLHQFTEEDGLVNANVLSIAGNADSIWFATFGGVSKAVVTPHNKLRFVPLQSPLQGGSYIYDLVIDNQSELWLATDGQGVRVIKDNHQTNMLADSLMQGVFYVLEQSGDSALWMASPERGVFRWKNDTLLQLGSMDGLSSSTITSLLQTRSSYLLAVGYDGFDLINLYDRRIIPLSKQYGLPAAQSGLGVVTINDDGIVFIGTNEGIVRLENLSELANRKPLISMKKMMANLETIDYKTHSNLSYDQRQVSISFAGLWYANPGRLRFQVDLSGQGENYFVTRDQTLHFGNLQAGEYRLKIKELNETISNSSLTLSFNVGKPFWLQWWFLLLVLTILASVFYFWIKAREQRIKLQQNRLREKAEFEYRILRSQVNPHFLFNSFSTLIALIEDQKEDAVGYVEKLSDFFRQILEQRDATLIGMDQELKLLETYLFLQQKRYGKSLITRINLSKEAMQSNIPPMTLQMLAENAIKHNIVSKSMPLRITIASSEREIIFENQLQPKIKSETSTGLGLQNIAERYRLSGSKTPVVINDGKHFKVLLPFID